MVILALWLAFPFLQTDVDAQDAIPFVAAGELVRDRSDAVYPRPETPTSWTLDRRFVEQGCRSVPDGATCDVLPFLSPPVALPLAWLAGVLGPTFGVLAFRLIGCLAAAGGVGLLLRRFDRAAAPALLVSAILLTPMVYVSSAAGQTSSLLFASVTLGIATSDRTRPAALAALVWAGAIAFKLFPLGLVPVALVARRWRLLAWAAASIAALAAAALVLAPVEVWSAFTGSTRSITATTVTSEFNLSIDAMVHRVAPSWNGTSSWFVPAVALRALLLAGLFAWRMRRADPDIQWAWAWVALLLVQPQVWWHYSIVVVGALAVGVAYRRDHPSDRWLVAGAAGAALALTVFTDQVVLLVIANAFAFAVLAYLTVLCAAPTARPATDDVVERPR